MDFAKMDKNMPKEKLSTACPNETMTKEFETSALHMMC